MLKQAVTRTVFFNSINKSLLIQPKESLTICRRIHSHLRSRCVFADTFKEPITYKSTQNHQLMFYRTAKSKKVRHPYTKPLCFNYAGDLKTLDTLNPSGLVYEYQRVGELESAPPDVKKLFTIGYASGKDLKHHRIEEMFQSIDDRLRGDCNMEREIAAMTIKIRNQVPKILAERHNKRHKHHLMVQIDKRKKMLKKLRNMDYERFLWLLKELQIKYVPVERPKQKQTREFLLTQQAKADALEMRNNKLRELKEQLEAEKIEFLKKKEDVMVEIEKDIQQLSLDREDLMKNVDKLRQSRYKVETKTEESMPE